MTSFRERSTFNNIAISATKGSAPFICQVAFEVLDQDPFKNYRFHVEVSDDEARKYIEYYISHFGISDLFTLYDPVENSIEWLHSKDIYIMAPMEVYAGTALFALNLGLKVYIPFGDTDIYREMDDIYKYQTTTDLVSRLIEGKGDSHQSAQIASLLKEKLSL